MLELRPVGALVGVTLPPLRSKLSNHAPRLSRAAHGVDAGRAAGQEQQLSLSVAAAMRAAARPEE